MTDFEIFQDVPSDVAPWNSTRKSFIAGDATPSGHRAGKGTNMNNFSNVNANTAALSQSQGGFASSCGPDGPGGTPLPFSGAASFVSSGGMRASSQVQSKNSKIGNKSLGLSQRGALARRDPNSVANTQVQAQPTTTATTTTEGKSRTFASISGNNNADIGVGGVASAITEGFPLSRRAQEVATPGKFDSTFDSEFGANATGKRFNGGATRVRPGDPMEDMTTDDDLSRRTAAMSRSMLNQTDLTSHTTAGATDFEPTRDLPQNTNDNGLAASGYTDGRSNITGFTGHTSIYTEGVALTNGTTYSTNRTSNSDSSSGSGTEGVTNMTPRTPATGNANDKLKDLRMRIMHMQNTTALTPKASEVPPERRHTKRPREPWTVGPASDRLSKTMTNERETLAETVTLQPQSPGAWWPLLRFDIQTVQKYPERRIAEKVSAEFFKATGMLDSARRHAIEYFYIHLQYGKLHQALGNDEEAHDVFNEMEKRGMLPRDDDLLPARRALFAARLELSLIRGLTSKAKKLVAQSERYRLFSGSAELKERVQAIANRASRVMDTRKQGINELGLIRLVDAAETDVVPVRETTVSASRSVTSRSNRPTPAKPIQLNHPSTAGVTPIRQTMQHAACEAQNIVPVSHEGSSNRPKNSSEDGVNVSVAAPASPAPIAGPMSSPPAAALSTAQDVLPEQKKASPPASDLPVASPLREQAAGPTPAPAVDAAVSVAGPVAAPAESAGALPSTELRVASRETQERERESAANRQAFGGMVSVLQEHGRVLTVQGKSYIELEKVGKGGSSEVLKVMSEDFQICALKRVWLDRADENMQDMFLNEIGYLERLKGTKEIIALLDYECANGELLIVLEYGEIDLDKHMQNHQKSMRDSKKRAAEAAIAIRQSPFVGGDEVWVRLMWQQMLRAVQAIHEQDIVHRDLKPANFVFVQGSLKLIDFGIAKAIQDGMTHFYTSNQVGTLNYISPEALTECDDAPDDESGEQNAQRTKQGRASDVWSLGCILYRFVFGRTPYGKIRHQVKKINAIASGEEIEFPNCGDRDVIDVLKRCLQHDPRQRPTIAELLSHRFLHPSQ